jgi:hypothetical protein
LTSAEGKHLEGDGILCWWGTCDEYGDDDFMPDTVRIRLAPLRDDLIGGEHVQTGGFFTVCVSGLGEFDLDDFLRRFPSSIFSPIGVRPEITDEAIYAMDERQTNEG